MKKISLMALAASTIAFMACESSTSGSDSMAEGTCSVKSSGNSVTFSGAEEGLQFTYVITIKNDVITTEATKTYSSAEDAKKEYEDFDKNDVDIIKLAGNTITYTESEDAQGISIKSIKDQLNQECNSMMKKYEEDKNQNDKNDKPVAGTASCNFKIDDDVWQYSYPFSKHTIYCTYKWVNSTTVKYEQYQDDYHLEEYDYEFKENDRVALFNAAMEQCKLDTHSQN